MTRNIFRGVALALLAAAAAPAHARDIACQLAIGVVQAGSAPSAAFGGLPAFGTAPIPVLTLQSYPALVGFEFKVFNFRTETPVVTGVSDVLLDPLGGLAPAFGAVIAPGFTLGRGGSTMLRVVAVASQEKCVSMFGGSHPDAPTCSGLAEDRFLVEYDSGSVECRARIVCGAPRGPQPPPPLPAAGCATVWAGPRRVDVPLAASWFAFPSRIALDASCNATVTGSAIEFGTNGPPGVSDVFLARLDAAGNTVQNVRFDAPGANVGVGAAVTPGGDRFVAWNAGIMRTPPGVGIPTVSRFSPDGTEAWRRSVTDTISFGEGGNLGNAFGIGLDAVGNAVVVGYRAINKTIWATKLDAASGAVIWSRLPSDALAAFAQDAAVDGAGDVIFCGITRSTDLPANTGLGNDDAFVAKLGPDGDLLWARQFGTSSSDAALGCAVDAAGDAYVVGSAGDSAFLAKYDPAGNPVWWRDVTPATGSADANRVAVDAAGDAWVVGTVSGGGFGGQIGQFPFPDAFVARYDASGAQLWAREFGTSGFDAGEDVAVDVLGNAYALTTQSGAYGVPDAMIVYKLGPDGTVQ